MVNSPLPFNSSNQTPSDILHQQDETQRTDLGSAGASFFVSVIVHLNLLLILAMTFRAFQEDSPAWVIDATFQTGEEETLTTSVEPFTDVEFPVEDVVFTDVSSQSAEELTRTEQAFDLPGLKEMGGADGIGGGGLGGGVGFFGTTARGRSFVFVVDCSGSMQGSRFHRAVTELRKSLEQLEPTQKFQIVFFSDQALPMVHSKYSTNLVPASRSGLQEAYAWIRERTAAGGTIPDLALVQALALKPDVIFFLTDADRVPRKVRTLIADYNKHKSTVHTIAFGHRGGEPLMQGIAEDHHGRYRFVP